MLKFFVFILINLSNSIALAQSNDPLDNMPIMESKQKNIYAYDPLDHMPIMEPQPSGFAGMAPIEQRGPEFLNFLSASVKIGVNGASGSGTIIYYDSTKNIAYVASCGHMWNQGTMSVEEGNRRKMTCKVITWYHNEKKLKAPKSYDANVIFYSYIAGQDTSLVTFTPDWQPEYFPIASINYEYKVGQHAHSLGCDGGNEVAHYDIEMLGLGNGSLVTNQNSPRPGRSGGGLMDDNGYYIGTCWGTQYRDGSGKGFFTPLSAIHRYWSQQNGYQFLLNQKPGGIARQIPIVNRNSSQTLYEPEYILIPGR
jgi:hypothetical protein